MASKFRTQYSSVRCISNPGSPIHILYGPRYDENGVLELVEKGRENIYDLIQSHKDSVDIHILLKRFEAGDVDVLSKVQGVYADVTDLPKNYADLLNKVIDGENAFMELPVELRAKFNHSFAEFLQQSGSKEWLDKLGVSEVEVVDSAVEEVKEKEVVE